ncbi:histone-lysine N-methyltransferase SETD1B-like [Mangifera indica]|uniref:histone-lysine N-methyltransferase SETD1B-like n=1 Tax=Mangifera indica TaxID=29780 RepID=UPI001CFAF5FE|nr:histone-lysine N-methyltransferase SETD1B-like [Mangifera indica]
MEICGEDGSKIALKPNCKTVFGRGSGINTSDRTVSRRHAVLSLEDSDESVIEPTACFEVIGKNPIWVRSGKSGKVEIFRRSEKGSVTAGDWVCFGGQSQGPVWFSVKRTGFEEEEKENDTDSSESSLTLESVDVSNIDPVKEFGFLEIGHEFDQYPKGMICDISKWDWFLEEPRKDSDEEDDACDQRYKRGVRRKRGKAKDNADDEDDWTGESEEDKELITKVQRVPRSTYSTRSKDRGKAQKGTKNSKILAQNNGTPAMGDETDDEDDPTLGGFIVDDEDMEIDQETNLDEEEEEEEFDDDD